MSKGHNNHPKYVPEIDEKEGFPKAHKKVKKNFGVKTSSIFMGRPWEFIGWYETAEQRDQAYDRCMALKAHPIADIRYTYEKVERK